MNRLLLPGLELPIIQAPMAGVQDSALALAVCHVFPRPAGFSHAAGNFVFERFFRLTAEIG